MTDKEITVYVVDDQCEVPVNYDDLQSAVEYIKELMECIDYGYKIIITKKKMTKKEFEELPVFKNDHD